MQYVIKGVADQTPVALELGKVEYVRAFNKKKTLFFYISEEQKEGLLVSVRPGANFEGQDRIETFIKSSSPPTPSSFFLSFPSNSGTLNLSAEILSRLCP